MTTLDVHTAGEFLDFGARIGPGPRAEEQLQGAVALHNILQRHRVAYLADEVGMGKTLVALGALALLRHYNPNFRALVIAPRENIQNKWMKELRNFVKHNVRFADLRVKGLDGRPARPLVACARLTDWARESQLDPDRDVFLRLSSFSLAVAGKGAVDSQAAHKLLDEMRRHLPWLADAVFELRSRQAFKDDFARALCCAIPEYDLVIVDEGHNLKHGFSDRVAARNRVLALVMGQRSPCPDPSLFPGYGPRAMRVLFLSATPVEETYCHLWNQLDIFGHGQRFAGLTDTSRPEEELKEVARKFLIRRVTSIRLNGVDHTKNLYRREWRRGGLVAHDEPIKVTDPRQRLIVALVQKKVAELLGHERFGSNFQTGMLASFESFLETTKLKRADMEEGNFDGAELALDLSDLEREGIDVDQVNKLAQSYRKKFGDEMPHPKMDATVEALANGWQTGEKSLVFVRRVASVPELKRKLDRRYDDWLIGKLRRELPEVRKSLDSAFALYQAEQEAVTARQRRVALEGPNSGTANGDDADAGGTDTFFAWFFRGEGPPGVVSGANVQQRFIKKGTAYSTFFAENHVAELLGCRPGEVQARLAAALGREPDALRLALRTGARRFLSRARIHARADRFEAIQAAAVELLKDHPGPHQEWSRVVWHSRYESAVQNPHTTEAPDKLEAWLELPTFFTELRVRPGLRAALWPEPTGAEAASRFREQELRAQLLASAARLGHAFIDLYILTARRLGSLAPKAQDAREAEGMEGDAARIGEYLDLLERQKATPRSERGWAAFDELAAIGGGFEQILDVNEPDANLRSLSETARAFGRLLGRQQPNGGMYGQVNQTLVRQFRMPGYPLVLITTDLLQEGEDLHTFCSSIHHYGIAWTPSGMEQRVGRIDRVRSLTELRLRQLGNRPATGDDMLQVYFPHLEDTIEVLQVQRVLERMNTFVRLMHEGLLSPIGDERSINVEKEMARGRRVVPQIREKLVTAFPVSAEHLPTRVRGLAVAPEVAERLSGRFARLALGTLPGVEVDWERQSEPGSLLGTARLPNRIQPFALLLRSLGSRPLVRCISPVGRVHPAAGQPELLASSILRRLRIGAVEAEEDHTYDLTVEGDLLLTRSENLDAARVAALISRVVEQADLLEQEHLPGQDAPLRTFERDLSAEASHGR